MPYSGHLSTLGAAGRAAGFPQETDFDQVITQFSRPYGCGHDFLAANPDFTGTLGAIDHGVIFPYPTGEDAKVNVGLALNYTDAFDGGTHDIEGKYAVHTLLTRAQDWFSMTNPSIAYDVKQDEWQLFHEKEADYQTSLSADYLEVLADPDLRHTIALAMARKYLKQAHAIYTGSTFHATPLRPGTGWQLPAIQGVSTLPNRKLEPAG